MLESETSIFSKVMAKVSSEFLTYILSRQEIYQAFLGLVRNRPGAELIYDQRKNTWYVGGSWDAICLIRQQMIVLVDCVFTFNNSRPSTYNSQHNAQLVVTVNAVQPDAVQQNQCIFSVSGSMDSTPQVKTESLEDVQRQAPFKVVPQRQHILHRIHQKQQQQCHQEEQTHLQQRLGISTSLNQLATTNPFQNPTNFTTNVAQHNPVSVNPTNIHPTLPVCNQTSQQGLITLWPLNVPKDYLYQKIDPVNNTLLTLGSPRSDSADSNASIIEKFDRFVTSKVEDQNASSDLTNSVTLSESLVQNYDGGFGAEKENQDDKDEDVSSDDNDDVKDSFGCSVKCPVKKPVVILSSAILDLSLKAEAVSVKESDFTAKEITPESLPAIEKVHKDVAMLQQHQQQNVNAQQQKEYSSTMLPAIMTSTSIAPPLSSINNATKLRTPTEKPNKPNKPNSNTCNICNKTFLNKSNMVRHAKSIHGSSKPAVPSEAAPEVSKTIAHHSATRYSGKDNSQNKSCGFCFKMFSTSSNLYKHARKCKQALRCSICTERFQSHAQLCHHTYVAHGLFLCRMCDKMADSEESYADHVNFCHPTYPMEDVVTSATVDDVENDASSSLKQPNPQDRPFVVRSGSCMGTVGVGGEVNKQVIRCHRPNPCLKCGKIFSTFSNLLKHIRVIHENARLPCNLCKRVFACKDGLKNHMIKIHNRIAYKCNLCSMEFENQLKLAKHLTLIHNQQSSIYNFQCEQCGKTFLYKTNLKRHEKLEHEGLRFSCQRCTANFRSKIQLNEHHRIVHLGLTLRCETCNRFFHTWTTLRDHERAVHGKHTPIVCAVCGKKFNRYPCLSYHLRKQHKRKLNVAGKITAANHVFDKNKRDLNEVSTREKRKKSKSETNRSSELVTGKDNGKSFDNSKPLDVAVTSLPSFCIPTSTAMYVANAEEQSTNILGFTNPPMTNISNFQASSNLLPALDYTLTGDTNNLFTNTSNNGSTYFPTFYDQNFQVQDAAAYNLKASSSNRIEGVGKSVQFPFPTAPYQYLVTSLSHDPSIVDNSISTNSQIALTGVQPLFVDSEAVTTGFVPCFNSNLYNDNQDTIALSFSDAMNFYDNFAPSPDQQRPQQLVAPQQQLTNVFHNNEEYVILNSQQQYCLKSPVYSNEFHIQP